MIAKVLHDILVVNWTVHADFLIPYSLYFLVQWLVLGMLFVFIFSDKIWLSIKARRVTYLLLVLLAFLSIVDVQYFYQGVLWGDYKFSHYFICELAIFLACIGLYVASCYRQSIKSYGLNMSYPRYLSEATLLVFGLYFLCLNLYTYFSGNFWDRDFISITQTIWKLSEGYEPYTTIFHRHFLNNHWSIIYYPIALIYSVFSHPFTLMVLANLMGLCGLYTLYHIAVKYLGDKWLSYGLLCHLLGLAAVHQSFWITINEDIYAFFFMAMSLYILLNQKNLVYFWFWYFLACLCKEDVSLLYVSVGLWLSLATERKRLGCDIVLMSAFIFLCVSYILLPLFNTTGQPRVLTEYQYMGGSMFGILKNFLYYPFQFLSIIFNFQDFTTFVLVFGILLLFLCFGGWTVLMFIPAILIKLININGWVSSFTNQHLWFPLLFLVIGVIYGLAHCRRYLIDKGVFSRKEFGLACGLLFIGFGCAQGITFSEYNILSPFNFVISKGHNDLKKGQSTRALLAMVPKEKALMADAWILSLSPERQRMYEINAYYEDSDAISQDFTWTPVVIDALLEKVSFCLFDRIRSWEDPHMYMNKQLLLKILESHEGWERLAEESTLVLFRKRLGLGLKKSRG